MRRLLLPALASIALVAFGWWGARERGAATPTRPATTPEASAPVERIDAERVPRSPAATEAEPAVADARARQALVPEPAAPAAAGEPGGHPRCRVFGRVLDVRRAPIEGVRVSLDSVGQPWVREGLGADAGFLRRVTTDAEGRYAFDAPLPTSDWISLSIEPSPLFQRAGRHFGLAGGRNEPPLVPGDNDLDDIVLADAGGFSGRVVDEAGRPISRVFVSLTDSFPGGRAAGGSSDSSGVFRVGGVPTGRYEVEAQKDGYQDARRPDVEVRVGEITPGVDLVLERALTLAGRVVDEDGSPLAGVKLSGWPRSSGSGAGGRTAADGTFSIPLPQDDPYTLGADRVGYESIPNDHGGTLYEPGTEDIRLVMRRADLATFRVRDARTGNPVERFGLKIIRARTENGQRSSSSHREPAEIERHADGELQAPGDPRYHDYTIVAPGYGSQRGTLAWDAQEGRVQTILLEPAGTIRGRFRGPEGGLATPTVRLAGDRIPLTPGAADREDDLFSDDWGRDLDEFAARVQQFRGGPDGAFELDDLAAGTYELTLDAPGFAPLVLERLEVRVGESLELGDLLAPPPGEIFGVVQLGGGASAAGLAISLGDEFFADDERAVTLDDTGVFRFAELGAGRHFLWVEAKRGTLVEGVPTAIELGPAESKHVVVDLAARVVCRVEVEARVGGEPAAGAQVVARVDRDGPSQWTGVCAADGSAILELPGAGTARFELRGPSGLPIAEDLAELELFGGQVRSLRLRGEGGRLRLSMPARPLDGLPLHLRATLLDADGDFAGHRFGWIDPDDVEADGSGLAVDVGWVGVGHYALAVTLDGAQLLGEVIVRASETATCTLAE